MEATIRSAANPLLKRIRAVLRGRERGRIVLEGEHLVCEALRVGLELEAVLVAEGRSELATELAAGGAPVRLVTDELCAAASGLTTPPGVLALAAEPAMLALDAIPEGGAALAVVVAGVQDPGNLGALARTAEAAGADLLVRLPGSAGPWNPKALRGSMGSLLRLPIHAAAGPRAAWEALLARGFRHVVARTRGGAPPGAVDWSGRVALWVSAESGAWPAELEALAETATGVTIPMAGAVESLNVTAAAAVLLFAAGAARWTSS